MIPVTTATEPSTFESQVRTPGLRAIAERVGEKPKRTAGKAFTKLATRREDIPSSAFPTYWTLCIDDLMTAYDFICAYSCFRIHKVTGAASVDHMAPKSRRWDRVYEWTNYRLACSRMNARKNNFEDLIDPFEVQEDWFQLELVGFEVFANPTLDPVIRAKVETTVLRLRLNDFSDDRATDAENYWSGEVSMKILQQESPFVAKELIRQGRTITNNA